MKLSTALKIYGYKIINGDDFLWKCWPNSHSIDIMKHDVFISITYDLDTQMIHHIVVEPGKDSNVFNWYYPSSLKSYRAEAKERNITLEEDDPTTYKSLGYEYKIVSSKEILDIVSLKLLS